jgi:hypothetical protein
MGDNCSGGWLTDAIFQRYDITSDQDLAAAAEKIGTELGPNVLNTLFAVND